MLVMDEFMAQYGEANFESLVNAGQGAASAVTSGTLVEQMRKQAYLNEQRQNMEMEEEEEWQAYQQSQWDESEAEYIHEQLMTGASGSAAGAAAGNAAAGAAAGAGDEAKAEEAKAQALALYRAAEAAIREAAMQGEGVDEQTRAAYMATETQVAKEHSIKWRDRGPRGEDAPQYFKGQKKRESSGRYSTRGGTRQAEFAAVYAKGKGKGKKGGGKDSKGGSQKAKKGDGKDSKGGSKKGSKEDGGSQNR